MWAALSARLYVGPPELTEDALQVASPIIRIKRDFYHKRASVVCQEVDI